MGYIPNMLVIGVKLLCTVTSNTTLLMMVAFQTR